MTRPPTALEVLDLLAARTRYREWLASGHLEADHGMIADNLTRVTAQVEALKHQQITEAMSTLRDQAEVIAAEAELLMELREALMAFDAASAEEDVAMKSLMGASHDAPKNERGQFIDPGAVSRAAEPFRPRHQAAQDARLEAQDLISALALESARLAVKLSGVISPSAQVNGTEGQP